MTSKSKTISEHISISDIKSDIDQLQEDKEIKNDQAAHELKMHLNSVEHFEEEEKPQKIINHTKTLKSLIDHHKDEDNIVDRASESLHEDANSIIMEWKK